MQVPLLSAPVPLLPLLLGWRLEAASSVLSAINEPKLSWDEVTFSKRHVSSLWWRGRVCLRVKPGSVCSLCKTEQSLGRAWIWGHSLGRGCGEVWAAASAFLIQSHGFMEVDSGLTCLRHLSDLHLRKSLCYFFSYIEASLELTTLKRDTLTQIIIHTLKLCSL